MIATVRFAPADVILAHHPDHRVVKGALEMHAGMPCGIHLPPEKPRKHWTCGTQLIWRVTDETVIRVYDSFGEPHPPVPLYVCEHMVEMD